MLTLEQALQHGAAVGVKYYVKNSYDKPLIAMSM